MASKPIAVLISDVHYNLTTLPLADTSVRQAIAWANSLQVPLIVAGDLHDTKANMRAECLNTMIETFKTASRKPYILVGNHDRINEKAPEHALNFLSPYANIIDKPKFLGHLYLIPYQHDVEEFKRALHAGYTNVVHQGIIGSNSGEYIQDKSAITKDDVAGLRVISGHYHQRQTIDLPGGGKWDYIGNPYTLNYGEANDPEKGFQILMGDGSLEFVPTNLRKHVVLEFTVEELKSDAIFLGQPEDLVWAKITGTKQDLAGISKADVKYWLDIDQPFRLDLIPTDTETQAPDNKNSLTQAELLDSMIDSLTNTADDIKTRLKSKWKDLK